jgi:hypothetical protein
MSPSTPLTPRTGSFKSITSFHKQGHCQQDVFRGLPPGPLSLHQGFSWHRRGQLAARPDRVFLPPLLESWPLVARDIATTFDHHAYLLRLELAGMATLPTMVLAAGHSRSLYWKLNSAIPDNLAFRPTFEAAWRLVLDAKPSDPVCRL